MANTNPIFELTPVISGSTLMNADGTNLKTIFTAGSSGGRIDAIIITSNEAISGSIAFYINNGSADFYIGNVPVPPGSGYNSAVKVDGLTWLKPTYLSFIQLPPTYTLKAGDTVAVTSGSTITITAIGGNF